MAKSKGRLLAELLASDGKVKESKSALDISGGKLAPGDIPTLPISKLEHSSISIAGHSTSLGGSVSLNTGDITEHTEYKYYTDERVRSAISASGDLSYNSSTGVISFSASDSPVVSVNTQTGSVVLDSGDISEGSNKYYTDARVSTRTDTILNHSNHSNISVTKVGDQLRFSAAAQYGDSDVGSYLSSNGYATQSTIVAAITDSAPGTLDTLNELAAALGDDANFSTTVTNSIATKLPLSGGTMTGNLTLEDSELRVGDTSGDSWTRIKHNQVDGYGFDFQHNNATVIVNEQGSTNQVLVLGDVDAANYSGLFGIAHTTDTGSNWTKKLDLRGNGELYIGASGASRVYHQGYHPEADTLTTPRTIAGTSFDGSANIDISYDNLTNKPSNIANSDTVDGLHAASFIRSDATDTASERITFSKGINVGDLSNGGITGSNYNITGVNTLVMNDPGEGIQFAGTSNVHMYAIDDANDSIINFQNASELRVNNNKVWTVSNDGSGSGLDADLLDGIQGSSFLRSDTTDTFTNLVGGTLEFDKLVYDWTGSSKVPIIELKGATTYGWFYHEGSPDQMMFSTSGNTNYELAFSSSYISHRGNSIWHAGNDGSGSGLDADLLDGQHGSHYLNYNNLSNKPTSLPANGGNADTVDNLHASSFLRSDTADTGSGKITLTAAEGLEVFGIRGRAVGSQIGDFIQMYERVSIGYPSGWGAGGANSAPTQGLTTHGGAMFNTGNVSGAPLTFNGNAIWHAGNDGSGSGLDADTLDGWHRDNITNAEASKTWTSIAAASTQAKRYHIARLYGCPAHWDGNWQNIEFHVTAESYESGTLRYKILGNYGGAGTQADMIKMHLTEAYGDMIPRFRLVLGTPTDAGWDHSGQDTFYVDVFAEASHYSNWKIDAKTFGHGVATSNPSSGGATTVFYSSPAASNISTFSVTHTQSTVRIDTNRIQTQTAQTRLKAHSNNWAGGLALISQDGSDTFQIHPDNNGYMYVDKTWYFTAAPHFGSIGNTAWHVGNDGSNSGLDADLLDGQHGSHYLNYNNLTNKPTIPSLSGYATETYVNTQVNGLVDSAPGALNTLNELAAALGDDANFSTTVTNSIATKLPLAGGTVTGDLIVRNGNANAGLHLRTANDFVGIGFNRNVATGAIFDSNINAFQMHIQNNKLEFETYNGSGGNVKDGAWVLDTSGNQSITGTMLVGGQYSNNSYSTVSSTRLLFGGGNDQNNYHIGTNMENYGGNYTKLDLRWHTGIRMGAQPSYGGIRFFNNEDLGSVLFSIGKGDSNMRVEGGNMLFTGDRLAIFGPNSGYSRELAIGGQGNLSTTTRASIGVTNGNLHIDSASGNATYLNFYDGTSGVAFGSGNTTAVAWMGPDGDLWKGSSDNSGSKYWHAGNDSSGSGLDADLLDGQHGSHYLNAANFTGTAPTGSPFLSDFVHIGNANGSGYSTDDGSWGSRLNVSSNVHAKIEVSQQANSMRSHWYAHTGQDSIKFGTSTSHDVEFQRGGSTHLEIRSNVVNATNGFSVGSGNHTVWHAGNDGSGSGLDADLLDGYHRSQISRYQSGNDFTNGTLVTTNINSGNTNGDSFVIEISGKAYGSSRPHTVIAEGYIYNNTIINTNGSNIGGSNFTYLKVMNISGNLCFWWPRHGYWNSYDVYVRSSSSGTSNYNRVTSITNSTDPSNATKKIQINLHTSWTAANDGSGSGLDADTLDGQQASAFLTAETLSSTNTVTVTGTKYWQPAGSATSPLGGGGGASLQAYAPNNGTAAYMAFHRSSQYAINWGLDTSNTMVLGGWSSSTSTPRMSIGTNGMMVTAGQGTLWGASNDGSGSGLDADLLDGQHASAFLTSFTETNSFLGDGGNASTHPGTGRVIYSGQVSAGSDVLGMPTTNNANSILNLNRHSGEYNAQLGFSSNGNIYYRAFMNTAINSTQGWRTVWDSGNDGSGSGLDADLLDGQHASAFAPVGGSTTFRPVTAGLYGIGHGSSILPIWQYNAGNPGYGIGYEESSPDRLRMDVSSNLMSGTPDFELVPNELRINGNKVWNAGNDGAGSGLDADTVDGLQVHTARNNEANKIVRTNVHGYIDTGYINTINNDMTTTLATKVYVSNDNYIRHHDMNSFRSLMNVSANGNYNGREQSTSDTNYWIGSMGWGTTDLNNILHYGSGFWDSWSTPSNRPSTYTTHWTGINMMHYSASNTYHHGGQMAMGAGNPAHTYLRGWWANGGSGYGWQKIWTDGNDGSGSGLDADLLDGQQASAFLGVSAKAADSNLLDGLDSTDYRQYTWRSFTVGGDLDKFYPALFSVGNGHHGSSDLEIAQSNVHQNGSSHGAFYARFGLNITGWGHVPQMMTLREYTKSGNTYISKIADTDHATGQIGIWLRGSTTYYYRCSDGAIFDSVRCTDNQPFVSYDHSNNAYDVTITHATSVENAIFNDSMHSGKVIMTSNIGNYAWTSSNDGSNSGLDADLLDGQHGSHYLDYNNLSNKPSIPTAVTNNNQLTNGAGYITSSGTANQSHMVSGSAFGTTNSPSSVLEYQQASGQTDTKLAPSGDWHNTIRMGHGNPYSYYASLIAVRMTGTGTGDLYTQNIGNNSANGWRKHWSNSNDGSGSGLDADLLDGYNSAENGGNTIHRLASNGYSQIQNWQNVGNAGIYSASQNGAHFTPNTVTSYGTWRTSGSRNGYDGIMFDHGGDMACMWDGSGNGGFYQQGGAGWTQYFNVSNSCTAFGGSTTSSSYEVYVHGSFYATGNVTAYSDRRAKENIVQIDGALEKVNNLVGVYYNKKDDESKQKEIGFIAQDVNEVVPELVTYAEDTDQYGVKYQNTTALLVEAVKELTQQVNDLKKELEEIKNDK